VQYSGYTRINSTNQEIIRECSAYKMSKKKQSDYIQKHKNRFQLLPRIKA